MTRPDDAGEALLAAAEAGDRLGAWSAAARVIADLRNPTGAIPLERVRSLVWRGGAKYRWFDIAELIASAAAARPDATPDIRRLHAQMLMERGFAEEALARLNDLLGDGRLSPYDRAQVFGHVGRIHKDRFVKAAASGDESTARVLLLRALDEGYLAGYDETGSVWLGANAMALLARPEAPAVRPGAGDLVQRVARKIRSLVPSLQSSEDQMYAEATMVETMLATGDHQAALDHASAYVANPGVNIFALNNFQRQLDDIWRLDFRPSPCPELLAFVSAAVLEREGGFIRPSARQVAQAKTMDYQAVFGSDRFDSFENYQRGLERCAQVARIGRSADVGIGTGFVLPGRVFSDKLDDAVVMVTNAHVINESDAARNAGAVHPREAVITFAAAEGAGAATEFGVAQVLCVSPPEDLDFVIARLDRPVALRTPCPIAPVAPVAASRAPIRIIGHPSGRGLSLSANLLLDHQLPRLHYSTATEGGSSGSPVFNHTWQLLGLHHAGGDAMPRLNGQAGTYAANEGIWIEAIREQVRRQLG